MNELRVETRHITLADVRPVINGVVLEALPTAGKTFGLSLAPLIDSGVMTIEQEGTGGTMRLRYELRNIPDDFTLDSFGIQFGRMTNIRTFLRSGYFSWDGSYYVPVEELPVGGAIQGYAVTQLLPFNETGSVVIGFDKHDTFQQMITLTRGEQGFALRFETLWDRRERGDHRLLSEWLVILERDAVENALREWAQLVAHAMNARTNTPPISGWCSWYNLYANINEEIILQHLQATREIVQRENLPMQVFQIDDGFTPEMGDWLDVKPQFPRGIKPLLDEFRAAGFTPGLWIAPFMVGNRSRLYADHPDWVVKDRATGQPIAHMKFYSEFRWHKRSEEYYILDTTHPDAFAYLREVFRVWRHEWGCEYFKTDFMHFGSEYGADRAVWHRPGMTRIEIWRRTVEMIREEIGDALWLGCGCPLWASVGVVDAMRIGRDVGVEWSANSATLQTAQSLLRDQTTRNFGNRILWQADPDCILLRDRYHNLTDTEARSLALYAGMSAGLRVTSDHLGELSAGRLMLWKEILSWEDGVCHYPLLGQTPLTMHYEAGAKPVIRSLEPVLVQVLQPYDPDAPTRVFILNTGDRAVQRTYPLKMLGLAQVMIGHEWNGEYSEDRRIARIEVTLGAHEGSLWILKPAAI